MNFIEWLTFVSTVGSMEPTGTRIQTFPADANLRTSFNSVFDMFFDDLELSFVCHRANVDFI